MNGMKTTASAKLESSDSLMLVKSKRTPFLIFLTHFMSHGLYSVLAVRFKICISESC